MSIRRAEALAFLAAWHPRAGAQSPLRIVPAPLAHPICVLAFNAGTQLFTWGWNGRGQLGHGHQIDRDTPRIVTALQQRAIAAVACGAGHTIMAFDDAEVLVWGDNEHGQLGLGDKEIRFAPCPLSLPTGHVGALACGFNHTVVIIDGQVFVMGENSSSQLGLGDRIDRDEPCLVDLPQDDGAVLASCGYAHTVVSLESGKVYCWGSNNRGQLGVGDNYTRETPCITCEIPAEKATSLSCGDDFTMATLANGELYGWGDNSSRLLCSDEDVPQLFMASRIDTLPAGRRALSVACGPKYAVVILDGGDVFSWGANDNGQLGLGHDHDVPTPSHVSLPQPAVAVACADCHTAVILCALHNYCFNIGF
eukprot:TRINITY_DN5793_c0_g1_i1.p1 TRINITY_DN5793_c0_g1~~TRINITY_DN5793_c0_g1_i1.p1  ORF type:complete len:365 (+),score=48.21 TRINITY_DN5793_c0_g1_i1:119-1213(+)